MKSGEGDSAASNRPLLIILMLAAASFIFGSLYIHLHSTRPWASTFLLAALGTALALILFRICSHRAEEKAAWPVLASLFMIADPRLWESLEPSRALDPAVMGFGLVAVWLAFLISPRISGEKTRIGFELLLVAALLRALLSGREILDGLALAGQPLALGAFMLHLLDRKTPSPPKSAALLFISLGFLVNSPLVLKAAHAAVLCGAAIFIEDRLRPLTCVFRKIVIAIVIAAFFSGGTYDSLVVWWRTHKGDASISGGSSLRAD